MNKILLFSIFISSVNLYSMHNLSKRALTVLSHSLLRKPVFPVRNFSNFSSSSEKSTSAYNLPKIIRHFEKQTEPRISQIIVNDPMLLFSNLKKNTQTIFENLINNMHHDSLAELREYFVSKTEELNNLDDFKLHEFLKLTLKDLNKTPQIQKLLILQPQIKEFCIDKINQCSIPDKKDKKTLLRMFINSQALYLLIYSLARTKGLTHKKAIEIVDEVSELGTILDITSKLSSTLKITE